MDGFEIDGLAEFLSSLDDVTEELRGDIWDHIKQSAKDLRDEIRNSAPARQDQRLRKSIKVEYDQDALEATVYTNLFYSIYPEYGTTKQAAHPYFNPSVERKGNAYLSGLEKIVK